MKKWIVVLMIIFVGCAVAQSRSIFDFNSPLIVDINAVPFTDNIFGVNLKEADWELVATRTGIQTKYIKYGEPIFDGNPVWLAGTTMRFFNLPKIGGLYLDIESQRPLSKQNGDAANNDSQMIYRLIWNTNLFTDKKYEADITVQQVYYDVLNPIYGNDGMETGVKAAFPKILSSEKLPLVPSVYLGLVNDLAIDREKKDIIDYDGIYANLALDLRYSKGDDILNPYLMIDYRDDKTIQSSIIDLIIGVRGELKIDDKSSFCPAVNYIYYTDGSLRDKYGSGGILFLGGSYVRKF
jgi:hypothetical protein